MPAEHTTQLVELDRDECLRLLGTSNLGRLAVNAPGGAPVIRPVNYRFDPNSNSIVFRSADGSKFDRLVLQGTAAFEIDGTDSEGAAVGWSVIVIGVAEEITHASDVHHVEQLGLQPLAPGSKPHWIRIRANVVSGRRIALVEPD